VEHLRAVETRGLSEEERAAAEAVVDLDAAENDCPACGATMPGGAARCPDCGLRFGPG
jgi:tRNA(Ile2) C34 agmatinyltransferase TiaS